MLVEQIGQVIVKATQFLHPNQVEVVKDGIRNDRAFALVEANGNFVGSQQHSEFIPLKFTLKNDESSLMLELPDGRVVEGPTIYNNQTFSIEHAGLRSIDVAEVEGPWTKALTAFAGRPIRLVKCLSKGGAIDVFPITFLTSGSLRRLEREVEAPVDPSRLRAGFIISNEVEHEEDSWSGRSLGIGTAVLKIRTGVPRCQVVGFNPKEGQRDQDVMKALINYRDKVNLPDGLLPNYATPGFATYAEVIQEGTVAIGDSVRLIT